MPNQAEHIIRVTISRLQLQKKQVGKLPEKYEQLLTSFQRLLLKEKQNGK